MAVEYIVHYYQWFRCKNLKYNDTDYLLERDTLKTKKGDGIHYYNDLPYTIVTVTGNNIPVSAGGISSGNGNLRPLTLVSGVIDGTNDTFVWSDIPVIINFQNSMLTNGNGFTGTGNSSTIYTPPMIGQILSALG